MAGRRTSSPAKTSRRRISLSGWTSAGTTLAITSPVHSGSGAAQIGSTTPSTDSTLAQTFTVTTGSSLSFWYKMTCPDTVTYDWFTVTLKDNTTGTTTVLGKTCATNSTYTQVQRRGHPGHSYPLTLTNHDDNYRRRVLHRRRRHHHLLTSASWGVGRSAAPQLLGTTGGTQSPS